MKIPEINITDWLEKINKVINETEEDELTLTTEKVFTTDQTNLSSVSLIVFTGGSEDSYPVLTIVGVSVGGSIIVAIGGVILFYRSRIPKLMSTLWLKIRTGYQNIINFPLKLWRRIPFWNLCNVQRRGTSTTEPPSAAGHLDLCGQRANREDPILADQLSITEKLRVSNPIAPNLYPDLKKWASRMTWTGTPPPPYTPPMDPPSEAEDEEFFLCQEEIVPAAPRPKLSPILSAQHKLSDISGTFGYQRSLYPQNIPSPCNPIATSSSTSIMMGSPFSLEAIHLEMKRIWPSSPTVVDPSGYIYPSAGVNGWKTLFSTSQCSASPRGGASPKQVLLREETSVIDVSNRHLNIMKIPHTALMRKSSSVPAKLGEGNLPFESSVPKNSREMRCIDAKNIIPARTRGSKKEVVVAPKAQ